MLESTYYRAIALYIKVRDLTTYLDNYSYLERSENDPIINFMKYWLTVLENEVSKLLSYFPFKDELDDNDIKILIESIVTYNFALKTISENMIYVPLKDPPIALNVMVREIFPLLIDEVKVKDIYYKTIPEDNFTESNLKKPELYTWDMDVKTYESNIPNVLSITAIYYDNPLMWPLIFHEYGHIVFMNVSESDYGILLDDLYKLCYDKNIKIERRMLESIITEIFADIFAINYYSLSYFFSFYFYEFLPSNIDCINKSDFLLREHPPSTIRIKYMLCELKKLGFIHDKTLKKILKLENQFNNIDSLIPKTFRILFLELYEEVSSFFGRNIGSRGFKLDYKELTNLYKNVKDRCPIGTSFDSESSFETALYANKTFDLEKNNKIFDIIYIGWKYFIMDIINGFYNTDTYLTTNRASKAFGTNRQSKIKKFNDEYSFLLANLRYSIETSMITSYYLSETYDQ